MYLRSGNHYRSGRNNTNTSGSQRSSEESVSNAFQNLETIIEEDTLSESTSSMSSDSHQPTADMHENVNYSMAFNVRLAFAKTNAHDAQLYKDPMNRWVVKIEE